MMTWLRAALGLALNTLCVLAIDSARADSGTDPGELERTWQAAPVYMPGPEGSRRLRTSELAAALANRRGAPPIVVYAHGCAGLDEAAASTGQFLAGAGYLVVEPDSFARRVKPTSCDARQHVGGLHRGVLAWRHSELKHAIRKLREIPALRGKPVVLMGFSEGGISVATLRGAPVRARVIEGWTCHAGWPEYRGLSASSRESVLALVGNEDPWWRASVLHGDCGAYFKNAARSRSMVYPSGNHWLSSDPAVRGDILKFLSNSQRP